jgi:hypothetical protein
MQVAVAGVVVVLLVPAKTKLLEQHKVHVFDGVLHPPRARPAPLPLVSALNALLHLGGDRVYLRSNYMYICIHVYTYR